MAGDRFDKLLWIGFFSVGVSLLWVLISGSGGRVHTEAGADRGLEQELAARARIELVEKLYAPVSELIDEQRDQQALLKLEELLKRYPGEAHGFVLKAEILWRLDAREEAVASMVEGVRRNGDYLEANSPLNRRGVVTDMVEQGQPYFAQRLRGQAPSGGAEQGLKNIYYLQSRLAGGCE